MRRPILFVLAAGSAPCCCSSPTSVTPPPCSGSDASHCPYYYTEPADSFYQVWINGQQSFVYQAEIPAKCKTGHINCARHCEPQQPLSPPRPHHQQAPRLTAGNVQSQSFTLASTPAGSPVEVRVVTSAGRLANTPFKQPRVASGFVRLTRPPELWLPAARRWA